MLILLILLMLIITAADELLFTTVRIRVRTEEIEISCAFVREDIVVVVGCLFITFGLLWLDCGYYYWLLLWLLFQKVCPSLTSAFYSRL